MGCHPENIRTLKLVLPGEAYRFGVIDTTGISIRTRRDKMNYCNNDVEINSTNYYCKRELGHDGSHSYPMLSGDWQEEARRYCQNADYWREKYEKLAVERVQTRREPSE